ncbi:MAG TPA: ATPase, T2SS/T4P/T4SS family, partial [Polyangiaceae bacterium]|nr:ATPase, T2SS/T4P/T4SS family [Polyangiaceae bacterium]
MNFLLTDLLKRALLVGALEVRLVPGRRMIVVLPQGESEVKGEPQTPERINELLVPIMTAEARRALASGWAEWDFELVGKGPVRACAELKLGLPHVSIFLDRCEEAPGLAELRPDLPKAPAMRSPEPSLPSAPRPPAARPVVSEAPAMPPARALPEAERRAPLQTQPPLPPSAQVYDAGISGGSSADIDRLLMKMLEMKASDLHISTGMPPMVRVDGEMKVIPGYPEQSPEAVQRMVLPIVPPRNREEFSRTHDSDFAYELVGQARFRGNIFVDLRGMGGVFRVIPSRILSVDDLNLPKELLSLCHLAKGLVLVTGPTGSGKSTTLAAMIDYINSNHYHHILTIEDPIEFVHESKKS